MSTHATAAEIAVHYHRSVALPGAERGVESAVEAADQAQATGAYDEAATFLRMALDLLPAGDDRRPRLLGRLGIVLAWALAFDDAVEVAGQAGDAIAEAETKQAAAEYLADAAYACARPAASWRPGAWPGRGSPTPPPTTSPGPGCCASTTSGGRPRTADTRVSPSTAPNAGRRPPSSGRLSLDPLGPAPMEAVFDTREEAAKSSNLVVLCVWGGQYTAERCRCIEAEAREAEALGRLARAARPGRTCPATRSPSGSWTRPAERWSGPRPWPRAWERRFPPPSIPSSCLCVALDEGWERVESTYSFLASSDNPALAWALGFARGSWAQAAARPGHPAEALEAIWLLVPWLERAPVWTISYPAMACGAAEALWVLERDDHLPEIEWALREKVIAPDFRSTGVRRPPGHGPPVRPLRAL